MCMYVVGADYPHHYNGSPGAVEATTVIISSSKVRRRPHQHRVLRRPPT